MSVYLSSDLPGTGGSIKESPEDFVVTEIPSYQPSGSGEHIYLTIEKRGITTLEAIRRIAKELNVPERDIGYAGMKDSVGITRQTLSVQRVKPEDAAGRDVDGVRIIAAVRHGNKLKLGHLKGNRFEIVVRDVSADAAEIASAVMDTLKKRGVPNWFGYQRYGAQGNSHLIGAALLRRDWKGAVDVLIGSPEAVRDEQWKNAIVSYTQGDFSQALLQMPRHCRSERDVLQRLTSRPDSWEKAFAAVHPRLRKLYLSAYQASLFDRVVELRLNGLDRLLPGDLAWKHVNGACFLVEDIAAEIVRAADFEISATGPMFGTKMKLPAGEVRIMEEQLLEEEGLSPQAFDLGGGLRVEGERRPLRVPLGETLCSQAGSNLHLQFTLPRGSYATSVMREITKSF
ncbi:tRNA pseudouridine(13) synthase TruD [Pelotalea chapellei]|uniref:tRNA pseudouridine synthase D n=1 Tax=Pelotalea chapellei TaxID=44671 RepID=A0ABS5UBI7_9BACT|nr:tRNA pseudouridine(13) synthase TruD [Pelotalea chapellei]MBT1073011.1 tRNA pseudouridine(13) synthase TruD [Pelotalea chapellei]